MTHLDHVIYSSASDQGGEKRKKINSMPRHGSKRERLIARILSYFFPRGAYTRVAWTTLNRLPALCCSTARSLSISYWRTCNREGNCSATRTLFMHHSESSCSWVIASRGNQLHGSPAAPNPPLAVPLCISYRACCFGRISLIAVFWRRERHRIAEVPVS